MEAHQSNQSQNSVFPELKISKALFEILQAMLCNRCPESVDISMKSTRKMTSLTQDSWFYIRVSTDSKIELALFTDLSTSPNLLELLEKMQGIESESHLCIQNCVCGEICQQNLVVEGNSLIVQYETKKQKSFTDSSLYIRVHQSQSHMMREAQLVYKFLQVVKIFRPRLSLQFTMKMGENMCRSNYCMSEWISVCPEIPEIVSKSAFYLYKSRYTAEQDYVKVSVTGPATLSVEVGDPLEKLEVTCLGVYIPVMTEAGRTSTVTLTLLGPEWFPVDISELGESALLGDLNLYKLGLKAATSAVNNSGDMPASCGLQSTHWQLSVQSTNKYVLMDTFIVQLFPCITLSAAGLCSSRKDFLFIQNHLDIILVKIRDKLSSIIMETLHKSLQLWLEKSKTRNLVYKSIRSVSKAVRDIVSMSNNENFRQEVFGLMQVDGTIDLEKTIESKLTDMSRRRHTGVWNTLSLDPQQDTEETSEAFLQSYRQMDNKAARSCTETNKAKISEASQVLHLTPAMHVETTSGKESQPNPDFLVARPVQCYNAEPNQKTPEIGVRLKDPEDISPFQQLADDLMDAVDNICNTELGCPKMQEEPYGIKQTEDEILAQLFNDLENDSLEDAQTTELNGDVLKQNGSMIMRKYEEAGNKFASSSDHSRILSQETRVYRPEISVVQKESSLKRSFSFPKDLEHFRERSSKFYRALSGDRLVPPALNIQQHRDERQQELEKDCFGNEFSSSHPRLKKIEAYDKRFESLSHRYSMSRTETLYPGKQSCSSFVENSLFDVRSGRYICQNFPLKDQIDADWKLVPSHSDWDGEFKDTFDVVSNYVDNCVHREVMEDIGGHLNSCCTQSQAVDKNNNKSSYDIEKEVIEPVGETEHRSFDSTINTESKANERIKTDSDDWFDDVIVDVESWFN